MSAFVATWSVGSRTRAWDVWLTRRAVAFRQQQQNPPPSLQVDAFVASGFVGSPIRYRVTEDAPFMASSSAELAAELGRRMEAAEGGVSRFGALSTVL